MALSIPKREFGDHSCCCCFDDSESYGNPNEGCCNDAESRIFVTPTRFYSNTGPVERLSGNTALAMRLPVTMRPWGTLQLFSVATTRRPYGSGRQISQPMYFLCHRGGFGHRGWLGRSSHPLHVYHTTHLLARRSLCLTLAVAVGSRRKHRTPFLPSVTP